MSWSSSKMSKTIVFLCRGQYTRICLQLLADVTALTVSLTSTEMLQLSLTHGLKDLMRRTAPGL